MAADVRISVLGPLEVRVDGRPVSVSARRLRTLLACLAASADRVVPNDALVDRVWDGELPHRARGALQTYVRRLRVVLGPDVIETVPGGYALRVPADGVDLVRFRALLDEARVAGDPDRPGRGDAPDAELTALRAALALYRGEPFADAASDWLRHEVVPGITEEWFAALIRRIDLDLAGGRHGELVAELRRLTAAHPLREAGWQRLMLALHGCGRSAEALAAYRRIHDLLRDELGLEPGAELRRIQRDVLAAADAAAGRRSPAAPPASAVPRHLPPDTGRFTGRTADLAALDRLLDGAADGGLVAIVDGPAGVGKTTLAVHWAHRMAAAFPDGQLYVNLRGYGTDEPLAPATVLETFLRALGTPPRQIPPDLDGRAAQLRSRLAGRRMLLLLDNARDATRIRPLLPGSGSVVLVTSRSRLRALVARDGAHRVTLDPLPTAESVALLGRFLGAERVAAERPVVEELAHRCANLPLALVIAGESASQRAGGSLVELVAHLRDKRAGLDALDTGDDPETDVRTVFSWSYRTLEAASARLFRLLGGHPGPDIGAPAAAALAGIGYDEARRLLDGLADTHQLRRPAPGRYEFHDLQRAYARDVGEREDPAAERHAADDRVLSWYLHTLLAARDVMYPGRPIPGVGAVPDGVTPLGLENNEQALQWVDAEYANLLAATRHALASGRLRTGHQLVRALWLTFDLRSAWDDSIAIHRLALAAARESGDRNAEGQALNGLGSAHRRTGRQELALTYFRRAQIAYREIGDPSGESDAVTNLGLICRALGRTDEAIEHHRRSLALDRAIGDPAGEAVSLNNLATAYTDVRRYREAAEAGEQALEIQRKCGGYRTLPDILDTLGEVYVGLGEYDRAIAHYEEALHLNRQIEHRHNEAANLANLGRAYVGKGQPSTADRLWHRSLEIFESLRAPEAATVRRLLADQPETGS